MQQHKQKRPADSKQGRYYSSKRVKKGLGHYLLGRAMNAIVSILVAIQLIRMLPVSDYGIYTALSGMMILLMLISSGGLERILPRYLTELRQADAHHQLSMYCWYFLGIRMLFLAICLLPLVLLTGAIADHFEIQEAWLTLSIFYLYVLANAASVHIQRTFQSLLHQKEAVYGLTLDGLIRLSLFSSVFWLSGEISLALVFSIQLAGSLLACFYLALKLRLLMGRFNQGEPDMVTLNTQKVIEFGWYNYLQQLSGLTYSAGMNKSLSGYLLGNIETALLGFAYIIYELAKRYMPAMLLLGLIEPVFMARYRENQDFNVLNEMSQVIVKINLFILMPFVVWASLFIAPLLDVISGGKYLDINWPVAGLLMVLVFEGHRLVLQLICNALDQTKLLFVSNLYAIFLLPVEVWLMLEYQLLGLIFVLIFVTFLRNIFIVHKVRKLGYCYQPDWQGMLKITCYSLVSSIPAYFLFDVIGGVAGSVLAGFTICMFFLLAAMKWKVFNKAESKVIKSVAPRGVWYW